MKNKKNQYWMKIKYAHDGVERWELTRGRWADKQSALKGYEARTRAMNGTILDAKPHEQFEFDALDVAEIERRNGLEIGPDGTVKELED